MVLRVNNLTDSQRFSSGYASGGTPYYFVLPPRNVIGKSTVESIQSGVIYGFSGQIDAIVDRFVAELGACTVVATGGLAELIMPFSRTIQHHEPWLTLHGLRIIFERNAS